MKKGSQKYFDHSVPESYLYKGKVYFLAYNVLSIHGMTESHISNIEVNGNPQVGVTFKVFITTPDSFDLDTLQKVALDLSDYLDVEDIEIKIIDSYKRTLYHITTQNDKVYTCDDNKINILLREVEKIGKQNLEKRIQELVKEVDEEVIVEFVSIINVKNEATMIITLNEINVSVNKLQKALDELSNFLLVNKIAFLKSNN